MNKFQLRKLYKEKRHHLSANNVEDGSLAIANKALQLPIWDKTYYHIFLSIVEKKEVDTEYLLHILQGKDKSVIISKADFQNFEMTHYLLQENTLLKISDYGIPEPVSGIQVDPSQIEVVFVPLLAYDEKGNRLGYGKGFYDRFLKKCAPKTLFVGLSFFEAEENIASDATDMALHYCVTPQKIYTF